MRMISQFKDWMLQISERRRAERYPDTGTVAYYWDGSVPVPHEIRDISLTGAYLRTPERWYPGTIVKVSLKTNQSGADNPGESIEVSCRVVRHGPDGVGLQFVSRQATERKGLHRFLASVIANLRRRRSATEVSTKGQALIEFAFMVPILFFLMILAINYGGFFYAWITVANATRTGVQYAVMGASSIGAPATPSPSAVQTLVANASGALPSSVSVCVNGKTAAGATCPFTIASIPADPEAPAYSLAVVDVNYTYKPFFGSFSLPGLGSFLLLMPTNVQMRTVMRVLN